MRRGENVENLEIFTDNSFPYGIADIIQIMISSGPLGKVIKLQKLGQKLWMPKNLQREQNVQ